MTPESQKPSVLVVEDDPMVLATLKVTLECEHFLVEACSGPLDALTHVTRRDFAVIISDHKMPEMMGLDFLVECRRLKPGSSRILLTAVLNPSKVVDAIDRGDIYRFVSKPWLRNELIATVRDAVERHRLISENAGLKAEIGVLKAEIARLKVELPQGAPGGNPRDCAVGT